MARRAVRATLSAPPLRAIGARRAARAWRRRRLLVVCHGNLYRSPFAERFAAPRLRPGQEIASAGVAPAVGSPSPEEAVLAAGRLGVDLHGQRSGLLDEVTEGRRPKKPATLDRDEIRADSLDLTEQVRGHDDRHPELRARSADQLEHLVAAGRVEPVRRLVEE